jgi:hypothetical protein
VSDVGIVALKLGVFKVTNQSATGVLKILKEMAKLEILLKS